ncbi:MAG: hypothetical protein OSB68_09810 [Dehalococcoidia bacterium]|nr:hypothetical protein [Dehalococcoidia bacterium]
MVNLSESKKEIASDSHEKDRIGTIGEDLETLTDAVYGSNTLFVAEKPDIQN